MKPNWAYEETSLQQRIDIHNRFAKYEINDWILIKLQLKGGEKVLDIGCGNGKQALEYTSLVSKQGFVVGLDINRELLKEGKKLAEMKGNLTNFVLHNANTYLPFKDESFDAVSCCFSIYYYNDLDFSIAEMKRVLKPKGRIFIAGPTPNNSRSMLDCYEKAIGYPIDQKREYRMKNEVIDLIQNKFSDVYVDVFENPIIFPSSSDFLDYFTATLLLKETDMSQNKITSLLEKMSKCVDKKVLLDGSFILKKEVYGITGIRRIDDNNQL